MTPPEDRGFIDRVLGRVTTIMNSHKVDYIRELQLWANNFPNTWFTFCIQTFNFKSILYASTENYINSYQDEENDYQLFRDGALVSHRVNHNSRPEQNMMLGRLKDKVEDKDFVETMVSEAFQRVVDMPACQLAEYVTKHVSSIPKPQQFKA